MITKSNKLFLQFGALLLILLPYFAQASLQSSYRIAETQSILIKLDQPLARALVGNSQLASVQVINPREILVSGEKAGRTELILWYRQNPNQSVRVELRVSPDQARQDEILEAVAELMTELDPEGKVKFDLRPAWIDPSSSIRRSIDSVGSQVDGDAQIKEESGENRDIKQQAKSAGSLGIQPKAGNYLLILSGEVANEARKKRIHSVVSAMGLSVVNMIKVTGPNQVQLSVRVAEVTKGNPFRVGFAGQDKRDYYGLFPGALPGSDSSNSGSSFLLDVDKVASRGTSESISLNPVHTDAFNILINPLGKNYLGILSILEEHNLSRVLARPELVVQAGKTASFLVGGEVPVPSAQGGNANGAVSVEFKEFGVRLRFSPIVTESGQIQMAVEPEISNIDDSAGSTTNGIRVPGFRTRKVSSTITIDSGQSFVIGGLIQENMMSTVRKIPLLGDIPVLGALFRSTSYDKDESELAIVVSAKFVEPIAAGASIDLPGENITRPGTWWGVLTSRLIEKLPEDEKVLPEEFYKIGLEQPL